MRGAALLLLAAVALAGCVGAGPEAGGGLAGAAPLLVEEGGCKTLTLVIPAPAERLAALLPPGFEPARVATPAGEATALVASQTTCKTGNFTEPGGNATAVLLHGGGVRVPVLARDGAGPASYQLLAVGADPRLASALAARAWPAVVGNAALLIEPLPPTVQAPGLSKDFSFHLVLQGANETVTADGVIDVQTRAELPSGGATSYALAADGRLARLEREMRDAGVEHVGVAVAQAPAGSLLARAVGSTAAEAHATYALAPAFTGTLTVVKTLGEGPESS